MNDRPSAPRSAAPPSRGARRIPSALVALPSLAAAALMMVLAACAGAARSESLPAPAGGEVGAAPGAAAPRAPARRVSLPVFPEPRVIRTGSNGILDVVLEADTVTLPVPTLPDQFLRNWRLISANGVSYADSANTIGYPGPTFRVSVGDSVRIRLINSLPAPDDEDHCMSYPASESKLDTIPECFHGPSGTNIHYHGFHISPEEPADDVLLLVQPGQSYQYAFRIPMNQSPGTHWYHPHKHGSVAIQVTNGMAGAFIVQGGGLDSISGGLTPLTNFTPMVEHLIAIQQVNHTVNLVRDTAKDPPMLVNGAQNPTVVMRSGEVQRWRIVNENISKTASYSLLFEGGSEKPTMYDVARDGVAFDPRNYADTASDDTLLVSPGNRLDVFVQAPVLAGTYQLRAQPFTGQGGVSRRVREDVTLQASAPTPLLTVLVVEADDRYVNQMPSTLLPLPSFLAGLDSVPQGDTAQFVLFTQAGQGGTGDPSNPPLFYLGTLADSLARFNENVPLFGDLPLGGTQRWKVLNRSTALNHPFHIHINPFQVDSVVFDPSDTFAPLYARVNAAAAQGTPYWFDTFPLPVALSDGSPGYISIRQAYEDFAGAYVMHCHILGHEERGMMQRIDVVPPGSSSAGSSSAGHAHQH
jgi:FtsP/CotA-like multicopper oxidase with cupredoxin domain